MTTPAETPHEIASFQHEQWLLNTCTKQAIANLHKMRQRIINNIGALSLSDCTDAEVRHQAISLRMYDNVLAALTETDIFIREQLNND